MAKISQSSVFAATQEIGVQTHSQPAYLRPSNRRDCHALQMNIDFMHFGTEIQRKRGFLCSKEPFAFARNMEEKNGFSFQGRNHTVLLQNTPNYDYEQKKRRSERSMKRNPISIITTKIQGGTAPNKLTAKSCREKQLQYLTIRILYVSIYTTTL